MILLTNSGSKLDEALLAHHRAKSPAYVDVVGGKGRVIDSPAEANGRAYRIEAFERKLVTHWQIVGLEPDVIDA